MFTPIANLLPYEWIVSTTENCTLIIMRPSDIHVLCHRSCFMAVIDSPVCLLFYCFCCRPLSFQTASSQQKVSESWHSILTLQRKMTTLRSVRMMWLLWRSSRTCGGQENSMVTWAGFLSPMSNFLAGLVQLENLQSKWNCIDDLFNYFIFVLQCTCIC